MAKFLPTIAALLFLSVGAACQAQDTVSVKPGYPHETHNGTVRMVDVAGTYQIAANETIADVRLYYSVVNQFGAVGYGQVQGTVNTTLKTWDVAYGDYQLYQYQVRVVVQRGTQLFAYYSPLYTY